jgi:hypothetical protein
MHSIEWIEIIDGVAINRQRSGFDSIDDAEEYALAAGITDYRITM